MLSESPLKFDSVRLGNVGECGITFPILKFSVFFLLFCEFSLYDKSESESEQGVVPEQKA